jgi:hypothetical protein
MENKEEVITARKLLVNFFTKEITPEQMIDVLSAMLKVDETFCHSRLFTEIVTAKRFLKVFRAREKTANMK